MTLQTVLIERYHPGEFIYSEANGARSRDDGMLASGNDNVQAGTILGTIGNESQTINTLTITGTPTGGGYTLTVNEVTTAPIAYNANAAAIQAALSALETIGDLNPQVSGTGPFSVLFLGADAAGSQPVITATGAFTGGTSPAIAVTQTSSSVLTKPKWAVLNLGNSDGSQTAAGILYGYTDATNGDTRCVVVTRDCEVNQFELTYPAGVTAAQIASIDNALAALGIIVRTAI